MPKGKMLNESKAGVSIHYDYQDRIYVITGPGGRKFIKNRAKAQEYYHACVVQVVEFMRDGLRVIS